MIVRTTNVFYDAKTVKIVKMVSFVPKADVFRPLVTNQRIVDWATNAFLNIVLLDVNIMEIVRRAKHVTMITIVSIHQVNICVI